MTNSRQRLVLAATSISYIVVVMDASIVNVALDRLAVSLATQITGLQWVMTAYTLAFAGLLLTGGTLGDRWGARNVYFAGLGIFTLGSAACGLAPSLPSLIVARVVQGIGAAMLVPCSLKLLHDAFPERAARTGAFGVWAACGGVALAAGPLIGGVLIHFLDWRSLFLVNVPIGLAGIAMTRRIAATQRGSKPARLDLIGQVTSIIALSLLIGVAIEGQRLGWGSPIIIGGSVAMLFCAAAFVVTEARSAYPMLPLALFKHRVFTASTLVSLASGFVFYGLLFVFSLYYQQRMAFTPLQTGLAFLPMTAMVAVGSFSASRIVKRCGTSRAMCGAFCLYATAALALCGLGRSSPYWFAVAPMLAIGLASGFISPAATAPAMDTVAADQAGVAAAALNAARQIGAALGVAVFGALLTSQKGFDIGMHHALWIAAAASCFGAVVGQWRAKDASPHVRRV